MSAFALEELGHGGASQLPGGQRDQTTQECMEVDVMENVFVKDCAEAPSSTVERTIQLCMTCDDNMEAAGFCVDCVEYLCSTCVEAHQRVKFTKDHAIRHKAEVSTEAPGASAQRPVFCDIHKQEPLKLFCETCDLLTCRDCQLVKHKDHNYQFLEDAYKSHKQHMESMTHQLQEKNKQIEEVSNSINRGLLQVDQNRTTVHNEIKKSICSLILEINKKGKMLVNQLEAVTKDHESILRKQQEDIGYLSRHLNHVINFTKWATARNGGTALLYCKRLILFQIGNLLRAKCSTSFIPQSTVRFQSRSSYWASNVDLGSLLVESVPGHQLGGFQGIPHQLSHPGHGPSGSPHGFAPLGAAPRNTLAQLQMQVDKLNPQANWQPQPAPPPWAWYQSVRLQRTVPGSLQGGGSPSQSLLPQPGRRFMAAPPPSHVSPTSSLPSAGFPPQPPRGMGGGSGYQPKAADAFSSSPLYTHVAPGGGSPQSRQTIEPTYLSGRNGAGGPVFVMKPTFPLGLPPALLHRSVQGQPNSLEYAAVSQEEKPGTVTWKPPETQPSRGAAGSAVKRRRRSSPGPVIVIKDEPDDDGSYVQAHQRASLPDSTGDQAEGSKARTPLQSTHAKPPQPRPPGSPRGQRGETDTPDPGRSLGGDRRPAATDHPDGGACATCRTGGGELLCCDKCPEVFHPSCHVPALLPSPPSGQWFCSLCRDPLAPEMEYDCETKPEAKTLKKEPECEGGFSPVDKRKCEKLLLLLFCGALSSPPPGPRSPSACGNNRPAVRGPVGVSAVRRRLEAQPSLSYRSPAEFVSDVRLLFGNADDALREVAAEVTAAGRDLFEERLRIAFPEQSFPEIKPEAVPRAPR
ncbi:E3 ubiquitin-protein ligase TRIM33-like isoform X2 [Pseudoliparis swirei]|uniref:E3 ubiquitin-protein ligase TRIM33-like isoform X2 n=1 Tax=Pseudoliparis swirei TaxID=2059687 RepID=UPI0024BEA4C1|nr:E3 ubiquitin-protein ligase TRIM33-like isoform X2 [Pseudoliparis swirei]